jgi:hypothetical protein
VPAAAATGSEALKGTIVTSGLSGTRTVIASVLILRGVFNGVGRIAELPNDLSQPDLSFDDLVFPEGTLHLRSTGGDFTSFYLNPANCQLRVTIQGQTGQITGGTGQFAHATGNFPTNTATVVGLAARDPDGSCSQTKPLLHDVEMLVSSGTPSF